MRKLLPILALAAAILAGCGSDDDASSIDTASEATDASSDSAGDSGSDVSEKKADTDFSGSGSGDFCGLARKFEKDFADTGDVDEQNAEKEFTEAAEAIEDLADEAPKEIEADVKVVGQAFSEFNKVLAKYDYDFTKVPPSESDSFGFDSPDVTAASARVESYFEKVCKIDSDNDGDTDGVTDSNGSSGDTTEDTLTETTVGE